MTASDVPAETGELLDPALTPLFPTYGEQVLHRRSVQDAEWIADLQLRVLRLERRRWWQRRRRSR